MALDATVGGLSSNSYVTVVEADAYFSNRLHGTSKWDALTPEVKESSLITTTNILDWHVTFKGHKNDDEQALQWPRSSAIRPNGTGIATDAIPSEVKQAIYEVALFSIDEDRVAENDLAGLEQVKAGPLMIKASSGYPSTAKEAIPDHVWKMLRELTLRGSIGVRRLHRA